MEEFVKAATFTLLTDMRLAMLRHLQRTEAYAETYVRAEDSMAIIANAAPVRAALVQVEAEMVRRQG